MWLRGNLRKHRQVGSENVLWQQVQERNPDIPLHSQIFQLILGDYFKSRINIFIHILIYFLHTIFFSDVLIIAWYEIHTLINLYTQNKLKWIQTCKKLNIITSFNIILLYNCYFCGHCIIQFSVSSVTVMLKLFRFVRVLHVYKCNVPFGLYPQSLL